MSQTVVTVDVGGTGANNANAALTNLGALPTFGGSITGNLNVSNNIVVTGNANLNNFVISGNSIVTTENNGDVVLTPNGDGKLRVRSDVLFGNGAEAHFASAGIDESTIAIGSVADSNSASEVLAVNKNSGTLAYSEFIAINDAGDQDSGWISIGVNSSNYDDPEYTLTGPDDGYLLFEPPQGTAANGDLIIGTGSYGLNNKIILAAGGFTPSDAQLIVAPADLKRANLVSYSVSSNVVTFVTDITHTFVANDIVSISEVGAPYDGTRTITAVTSNTLNVSVTTGDIGSVNLSPPGFALQFLPFNKGTVELTAQLFVGENSKSTIETANLTLSEGFAVPLGVVVNNDGPGQVSMFNKSNGALAYTEFIAQNDAADADMGWVSFGINSSGYDDPEFPITKADDAYLLYEPPANTTGDGDLIIGTGTNGSKNRLIFAAEGFDEANAQMIITPNESVRIAIATDASSSNTGALQVVGGVGVQGSMYVQGNQTIQGDLIVNGSQVIQSINELTASGPISLLSDGNIANTWDQGVVGTYAVSKASVTEDIAFKEIANNTATLTTSNNHSFLVEDYVVVANVDATFDGTHRITAVSSNTFSYFKLANNVTQTAATGTGTVDKSAKYTGVVKRASDGAWRVFSNLGTRPDFNTDFADANLVYDSIIAGEGTFNGSLKLGTPNTATITYTDANNRTLSIPALTGDRTFAFLNEPQTFTAAQAFSSTVTGTKFIPTAGDATGNGLYLAGTNKLALSADGVERISISASETVINDGGNDYDFRVESDGDANMLLVDGGLNRVGIGTGAPEQTLHVQGNTYISGNVGIGTTSPTRKFDVRLSANTLYSAASMETNSLFAYLRNPDTTVGSYAGIQFAAGNNSDAAIAGVRTADAECAIAFGTRGVSSAAIIERMRIRSDGNVGIGTEGQRKLHVYGGTSDATIRLDTVNADVSFTLTTLGQQDWGIGIDYSDSGKLKFDASTVVGAATKMTLTNAGYVGIATTSPGSHLQVGTDTSGDTTDYGIKVVRHGNGGAPGSWSTATPAITIVETSNAGPSSVDTNALLLFSMGRFGTTATNAKNASLIHVTYDSGSDSPFRLDGAGNLWVGWNRTTGLTSNGTMCLLVRNGAAIGSDYQTITPPSDGLIVKGRVGMGVTNPTTSAKLHVDNEANTGIYIDTLVLDNNTRDAIQLFENDGQATGRQAISWYNGNENYFKARIWTQVGSSYNATRFTIEVADNARNLAERFWIVNGNAFTSGTLTQNASDRRLKENIVNISNALDKVMSINGVTFNWASWTRDMGFDSHDNTEVGVIAQEIQSVLPEAVKPAPFDSADGYSKSGEDYLTVQTEKLVPLLIEAIKELKVELDAAKTKITALENK